MRKHTNLVALRLDRRVHRIFQRILSPPIKSEGDEEGLANNVTETTIPRISSGWGKRQSWIAGTCPAMTG
ncbi:MAG: hypothetical protein COA84_09805 [Robiginitomaculum sp.]|nr:MAG: hypothetical protein COA84_09805 [Robiginitomaculum sp.]